MAFLRNIVATVLAVLMLLSLTAGLADTSAQTELNVRIPDSFSTLDPQGWKIDSDNMVISQIYEPLFRVDAQRNETPVLATGYSFSDDYSSITFTLADDVYFTNGDKLTAADVQFSIERAKNSAYLSNNLTTVVSVDADDAAGTVTVHMSAATPGIIENISWVNVVSKAFTQANADENGLLGFAACGTGPYMLAEYALDDFVTLTANPDYRGGKASIETINFYLITDSNTAFAAFMAGDLDISKISPSNWMSLANSTDCNKAEVPANHVTYLIMNYTQEPFDNQLLRQAIAYAIGRDDIILMARDGLANPAFSLVTPYMVGYPEEFASQYAYNPQKAKELLAEAGYPDGIDIGGIQTLAGSYLADLLQVVQQQLAAVGITCTIEGLEASALITNCLTGNFGIADMGQTNSYDMSWLGTYYGTGSIGATNMAMFSDAQLDAKLEEAAVNMYPQERTQQYQELLETFDDVCVYVPIFNNISCFAWAKDLNYTPTPRVPVFYECDWN